MLSSKVLIELLLGIEDVAVLPCKRIQTLLL